MRRALAALRSDIAAGLLVIIPLVTTVWLATFATRAVDGVLDWLPAWANPERWLGREIPGLGILVAITVVVLAGAASRYYVGRQVVEFFEGLVARVPLLSGVYQGMKQLATALLSAQSTHFRQVVIVEYPRRNCYALAFLTSPTRYVAGTDLDEDRPELVNVFLPTTPNPTSGLYLLVPPERVWAVDVSVEEAFKLIMSAGIVQPEGFRPSRPLASPERPLASPRGS